jgi:hypothetical protein
MMCASVVLFTGHHRDVSSRTDVALRRVIAEIVPAQSEAAFPELVLRAGGNRLTTGGLSRGAQR